MDRAQLYVDVVVPLALPGWFTYRLPERLKVQVGMGSRVEVPFGSRRLYTAVVLRVHDRAPSAGIAVKDVVDVLDKFPVVLPVQLNFWQWLSYYYMCTLGEVMRAALPAGLKLESETVVTLCQEKCTNSVLTEREQLLVNHLSGEKGRNVQELEKLTGLGNLLPLVRRLMEKGIVRVKESLAQKFQPRTELRVRLSHQYRDEKTLNDWLNRLKRLQSNYFC